MKWIAICHYPPGGITGKGPTVPGIGNRGGAMRGANGSEPSPAS